jgi:hypothetical protein
MIKLTEGAYGQLAKLECEMCGDHLLYAIAVVGPPVVSVAQRAKLRDEAQKAGWSYWLGNRLGPARDLCPHCYTLPPEG